MHGGGEGHRQQCRPDRPQPDVAYTISEEVKPQADAAEEQDGEYALAEDEERPVADEGSAVAAQILHRLVRIDGVAWPVGRVEAGQREQEEQPPGSEDHEQNPTPGVGVMHWK